MIDPARTYPVTWSCTYDGPRSPAATSTSPPTRPASCSPTDVPVTSVCTATEGDLGPPSARPGVPLACPGHHRHDRRRRRAEHDHRRQLAHPGQRHCPGAEGRDRCDRGLHRHRARTSRCTASAGSPGTRRSRPARRTARSPMAATVTRRPVSIGWTCSGFEDTPGQDLLLRRLLCLGPPILDPPWATSRFVLPTHARPDLPGREPHRPGHRHVHGHQGHHRPERRRAAGAPRSPGPTVHVRDGRRRSHGRLDHHPVDQTPTSWSHDVLLGSVCTVTENDPGHRAARRFVGVGPAGRSARRHGRGRRARRRSRSPTPSCGCGPGCRSPSPWSTPTAALVARRPVQRRLALRAGRATPTPTASPSPPAGPRSCSPRPTSGCRPTAVCSITEDTLGRAGLRDASFAWGEPTYAPADVPLVAGQTASLGITNTVDPRLLGRHRSTRTSPARRRPGARRPRRSPERSAASTAPTRRSRPPGRRPRRPRRCGPACSWARSAPPTRTTRAGGPAGHRRLLLHLAADPVGRPAGHRDAAGLPTPPIVVDEPDRPPLRHVPRDKSSAARSTASSIPIRAVSDDVRRASPGTGDPIAGVIEVPVGVHVLGRARSCRSRPARCAP